MHRLEWKPLAEEDLANIVDVIGADSPASAARFAAELRAKTGNLPAHPELYRAGRVRGTRVMVVQPNYVVIYRVKKTVIEILRVKHTARKSAP